MFGSVMLINCNITMITTRNATIQDIDKIYAIECETYETHHWSKKSFINELKTEYSKYFVCESNSDNKEIVGYAGYWIVGNEGHITTMVVCQRYRRMHIADILLYKLINSAIRNNIKWLTLEVRASNIAAIALYSKYDFKQLGIRKNYYQDDNEDALILWTDDISTLQYIKFIKDRYMLIKNKIDIADILQYG